MDAFKDAWESSFMRGDNAIYYPKEEIVKFMNRYVRKRVDIDRFEERLLADGDDRQLRGLDYGCGIGRMTVLMEEFGLEAYGLDICETAIARAKELAIHLGFPRMAQRFGFIDSEAIPFDDAWFDLVLCEGVLDRIAHHTALKVIREIDRVTRGLVYLGIDSGDLSGRHREYAGEELYEDPSGISPGTMRNYFNWHKVQDLVSHTRLNIKAAHLTTEESVVSEYKYSRYYVVLEKADP